MLQPGPLHDLVERGPQVLTCGAITDTVKRVFIDQLCLDCSFEELASASAASPRRVLCLFLVNIGLCVCNSGGRSSC